MSSGLTGADAPPNPFDEDELEPTRVRDSLTGKKAGEYLLGVRLGQGAMGVVYKGLHPLLGREAAVKVLQSESADAGEKLLAEARLVAQARHPNIIDIFGFGTTEAGQPYFVMELLEGDALDVWLRNRPPLSPAEVVGILKQLFSGLAAAHAANVIHRDLKPSNLFMARLADGTHFLKILDFGLSKQLDPTGSGKTLGTIVGTPLYMAPEQTVGDPSTPATDLYAAGCIAYELLTGQPPFSAESVAELLRHQRETTPAPLPPSLPPLLDQLISSLLAKRPSSRPASATEARTTLEKVERKLILSAPSGAMPALKEPPPRPSRPPAPRPSRPAPAQGTDHPTMPLAPLTSSGSRRAFTSSQERETVRMEPIKMELPPRRAPAVRPVVEEKRATETELELPVQSNRTLIIVLVVGLVIVAALLIALFG